MESIEDLSRTHYCGELRMSDVGREVTLFGWVQRQRNLGPLIFLILRDRTGIVQLCFDENTDRDIFNKAFHIRSEFVVAARGIVRERSNKNFEIPTGEIEIEVQEFRVLAKSKTTPFEIVDDINVKEDLRLQYRYLDLRRPKVQEKILARHRIIKLIREYFDRNGFIEVETPILIKSTPEGARDYLVPSRIFNGNFFALPQSPQLYKQLIMLAGFDRYMQIAKCFRDEDLRADRQPEFTQIDFEMSFVQEKDVMDIAEGLLKYLYKEFHGIDIDLPLQIMSYDDAMMRFGSDKPDMRFGMELVDLSDVLKDTQFRVFRGALSAGGSVRAINAKNLADKFSRKGIDKLSEFVKDYGAKGLAFTKIEADGTISSSYEKFLTEQEVLAIREKVQADNNDVIFIVASDKIHTACVALGALRCELASKFDLIDKSKPCLLWINGFPLFEYSEEENRYVAMHHPFTAPRDQDLEKVESYPDQVKARAYDLVLNGSEIGGGSVRINNPDLQRHMLNALGFSDEEVKERFGFLIDAFEYGAPIHAGMAFGLDRLIMLLLDCDNIRDVIAFPKVASSAESMTQAPGKVDKKQLDELGISLIESKE